MAEIAGDLPVGTVVRHCNTDLIVSPEDQDTPLLDNGLVYIDIYDDDRDERFPARVNPVDRWNGWAVPLFSRRPAERYLRLLPHTVGDRLRLHVDLNRVRLLRARFDWHSAWAAVETPSGSTCQRRREWISTPSEPLPRSCAVVRPRSGARPGRCPLHHRGTPGGAATRCSP